MAYGQMTDDVKRVPIPIVEFRWRRAMKTFTAYVEWDAETNIYVGIVPGVPGAHTQGETLDELQENLKEVLELCMEEYDGPQEDLPRFVGLQQIEVAL